MTKLIGSAVARLAWQASRNLRAFCPRSAVILEYHSIPKFGHDGDIDISVFEKHIVFLKEHYEIIPGSMLWMRRKPSDKMRVILTFDDGFRNHAELVAPLLRKYNLPAMFFVSSRHCHPGQYLWFNYLLALERHFRGNGFSFHGQFVDMSPSRRRLSVQRLRAMLLTLKPHPAAMYEIIEQELPRLEDFVDSRELNDRFAGMTCEQLAELAGDPLFSIGNHTAEHPVLSRCGREEVTRQIVENKNWIERTSKEKCDVIAYPHGDYNADVLNQCRELGITHGYAETGLLGLVPWLEIPRVGIYSTSVDVLGFKVHWGNAYLKIVDRRRFKLSSTSA